MNFFKPHETIYKEIFWRNMMIYALAIGIVMIYLGIGLFKIYRSYVNNSVVNKQANVNQNKLMEHKSMMESLMLSRTEQVFFDKIVIGYDNLYLKGYAKTDDAFCAWKDKIQHHLSLKQEKKWNYLHHTTFEVLLEKTF